MNWFVLYFSAPPSFACFRSRKDVRALPSILAPLSALIGSYVTEGRAALDGVSQSPQRVAVCYPFSLMASGEGPTKRGMRRGGLYIILALSLVLHSYQLAYPAWDYHNWRQSITLMVARDFANHGFHVLHPQVAWVSHNRPADPSYFSAEFSFMAILAALLYKILGESDAVARTVVISFSLLGIWALYSLLRRRAGPLPAWTGAFVYAVLPYQVFFGRVFMPEIPAQALGLVALDVLDRWTMNRRWKTLLAASILTAMAILQKLTVAFVALPAVYLFWQVFGKSLFARAETWVFAGIAGVPAMLWYTHAAAMGRQSGLAIMQPEFFGSHLGLWHQPAFLRQFVAALWNEAFSPVGLGLAVVGLFWRSRSRAASIFRLWMLGAALVLFSVPELLPANLYYLAVLLPGGAALAGLALGSLPPKAYPVLVVVLAGLVIGAVRCAIPLYEPDTWPYDLSVLLGRLSSKDDLILTETDGNPNMLYYADRRGWMVGKAYNPAMADRWVGLGARYYVNPSGPVAEGRALYRRMDQLFDRLTGEDPRWPIYDLAPPAGLLRDVPEAEMQAPRSVNFGNQIELRGISLRRLVDNPACFEAIFHWRCLKTPDTDVHGFIHVIDSGGGTVYQQDHWPRGGRTPTGQWKPGQIIEERYVLVVPPVPAGKYQLRLGWYDPIRQTRLSIVGPGASDQEERATVGEIETHGPRIFRWLDVR